MTNPPLLVVVAALVVFDDFSVVVSSLCRIYRPTCGSSSAWWAVVISSDLDSSHAVIFVIVFISLFPCILRVELVVMYGTQKQLQPFLVDPAKRDIPLWPVWPDPPTTLNRLWVQASRLLKSRIKRRTLFAFKGITIVQDILSSRPAQSKLKSRPRTKLSELRQTFGNRSDPAQNTK